jgi:hypothetical protein
MLLKTVFFHLSKRRSATWALVASCSLGLGYTRLLDRLRHFPKDCGLTHAGTIPVRTRSFRSL